MDEHKINNILRDSIYGGFFDTIGLFLADGIYNSRETFNKARVFIDPYRLLMFSTSLYQGNDCVEPYLFKIKDGYHYNMEVCKLLNKEEISVIFDARGGLKEEAIEILNTILGSTATVKTVPNPSYSWPYSLLRVTSKKGEIKIDDNEYDEYYYKLDNDSPNSYRSYLRLDSAPGNTLLNGDLVNSPFFRYIKQYKLIS